MFCCCSRKPGSSYAVEEESAKTAKPPVETQQQAFVNKAAVNSSSETKIITGKGPLSTSNQNLAAGEANLDKTTISEAKREKSAVTEQPLTSSKVQELETQPTLDSQSLPSSNGVSNEVKSVSVISVAKCVVPPDTEIEKSIEKVVTSNPVSNLPSSVPSISSDLEKSINSSIDKVETELSEAESKQSKAAVPGLAAQLKSLTSQVLGHSASATKAGMGDQALGAAVSRLEAVASRLEALAVGGAASSAASGGDTGAVSPFVTAYDEIVSGPLAQYLSLSKEIGGDLNTQAAIVKDLFDAQRAFLVVASKSKQPDQAAFMEVLKPSATKLQQVQEFRENNRRSEQFNHLSAISESVAALGWVTISPAPGPYVKEMVDAGTFYTNRVLKDYREKDPRHVAWTKAWLSSLTDLQAYIKAHHTTGLTWNPKGGDAKAAVSGGSSAAPPPPPPAGGTPPPPPPPGPPPVFDAVSSSDSDNSGARSALFAELSQGENVTKGLRKVTDDMKTHKNPALRQGPAPFKATQPAKPVASPKPAAKPVVAKPPVIELQGKKWVVEYHNNNKQIVLDQTELKQSVYAFKCDNCVIQIKGKINSIILDSCKKTAVVFDSLLASLEFVNCQSMQAQVTGKLPTVSIDKTDGCMIYLSQESLDAEIVTAKSSEMNILIPQGDGDYKEFALPEQFKTKWDGKTMVTTMTESL